VVRRDFTMTNLLENAELTQENTIFGLMPEENLPKPIKNFKPIHYLKVKDYE